jgi:short-subunit dehydrogenase
MASLRIGSDTVVVITGASGGVGRATARRLAQRGARIGLLARGQDGLLGAKRDVEARGGRALAISADVSQFAEVEAAAERVERELGPIDVWINNAMVSMYSPFIEMTPEEFRHIVDVTFLGTVHGTRSALARMRPRDKGVIVQVGSALAFRSIPLQSAYCASKHAIQGFTESLRSELIHEGSRVWVCAVNMPALNTTQFTWTKNKLPRKARPTGTIYQPEVAADAILFAAEHQRRELMVGYTTLLATVGEKIIPGWLDRYLAKTAWDGAMLPEPVDPAHKDNFWSPLSGDHGAHGEFDRLARTRSVELWASKHRAALLGGVLAVGGVLAGALWSRSRRSPLRG